MEYAQRSSMVKAVESLGINSGDLIIISDIKEIPS